MRALAIALKYAKGLFIAAKELNKVEEFGEELRSFLKFLKENPEVLQVLQSPVYPPDIKFEILKEIVKVYQLTPEIERFVSLLIERRRIQYIEEIVSMYQALWDEEVGIARGEVYSPYPLSEEEKKELEEALQKKLNKQVFLEVRVDPDILGGIKVKIGDYVWDGTLKSQLEKFKEIIIKGV
ncbi:MAG: F0F1 ATP synthase subunit delta [Caldimicrobium sp.]